MCKRQTVCHISSFLPIRRTNIGKNPETPKLCACSCIFAISREKYRQELYGGKVKNLETPKLCVLWFLPIVGRNIGKNFGGK